MPNVLVPLFTAFLFSPDGVSTAHFAGQRSDELFDASELQRALGDETRAGLSPAFAKLRPDTDCFDVLVGRACPPK